MMSEMRKEMTFGSRCYVVDASGFLVDPEHWDEGFAEGMASDTGGSKRLTEGHWRVIRFIRNHYEETGKSPLVYQTCRAAGIGLRELRELFPDGYLRGACKLAGITYREGFVGPGFPEPKADEDKAYRVDLRGFLMDPSEWDESFAAHRAHDMKLPGGLTDRHWQVLRYLRERFQATGVVPTVYDACQDNDFDLEELETLFPDGYHRGAVWLAGLRVR
jgi:TusE/DsrC/DsvC family sulfur relay protein